MKRFELKQYASAIEAFSNAFDLSPDNDTIKTNLCQAYQASAHETAKSGELVDIEAGARTLEFAIAVDPENPGPLVQLGSYYLRLDYDQDAVFRLEEALQLDANNLDAKELLGDAYYKSNKLNAAIEMWQEVLATKPNSPSVKTKLDKAQRELSVEGRYTKQPTRSRFFEISLAPGTRYSEFTDVTRILDQARRDVGGKLGIYPDTITQVVVYTADDFSRATDVGAHVGALFDGKVRIPLQDSKGEKLDSKELQRRLHHEYVHVVLRYVAGNRVPWWFNEGLAETLSDTLTTDEKRVLSQAASEGRLVTLRALEGSQLEKLDPEALSMAYLQSHASVDYLMRRFGVRAINQLLGEIAAGSAIEDAMYKVFRRGYTEIERETLQSVNSSI